MTDQIPADAIRAAEAAAREELADCGREVRQIAGHVARIVLQAAAPAIRAAERERIRQMAESTGAVVTGDEGTSCYFAALLEEKP